MDLRRYPRYLYAGPVQLTHGPKGPVTNVTIVRLNVQGCGVEGKGIPPAGQRCELSFEWNGRHFRNSVEVRWEKGKKRAGLKFLSMDEGNLVILRALCATLKLEPLPPPPSEGAAKPPKPRPKRGH